MLEEVGRIWFSVDPVAAVLDGALGHRPVTLRDVVVVRLASGEVGFDEATADLTAEVLQDVNLQPEMKNNC